MCAVLSASATWNPGTDAHSLVAPGTSTDDAVSQETARHGENQHPFTPRTVLEPTISRSPKNRVADKPRISATQRAPVRWRLVGGHESEPTVGARFLQNRSVFRGVGVIAVGLLVHHVARPVLTCRVPIHRSRRRGPHP